MVNEYSWCAFVVIRCGTSSSSRRSSGSGIGGCDISGTLDNHLCAADQWLHTLSRPLLGIPCSACVCSFWCCSNIRNIVVEQKVEEEKGGNWGKLAGPKKQPVYEWPLWLGRASVCAWVQVRGGHPGRRPQLYYIPSAVKQFHRLY